MEQRLINFLCRFLFTATTVATAATAPVAAVVAKIENVHIYPQIFIDIDYLQDAHSSRLDLNAAGDMGKESNKRFDNLRRTLNDEQATVIKFDL